MKEYKLEMPQKVYCGAGASKHITSLVKGNYRKAVVFTDGGVKGSGVLDMPLEALERAGIPYDIFDFLPGEPTCNEAQSVVDAFRKIQADVIVAAGGGSVMDMAKLASIMGDGRHSVYDLLEAPQLGRKSAASVMLPTTAGTGAEATPNSIVAVPEKNTKIGIVNTEMIPGAVILDGNMTRGLPPHIAASTGVDALCHAIECFTSNKANPFSDLFALEALRLIFSNLEAACGSVDAIEAKSNMLRAAFYAGVAITASGTTAVHALAYPLGGRYHIPHGVANAIMLMPVMRFNAEACLPELARVYDALEMETVTVLVLDDREKAERLLARMGGLVERLGIPASLSGYGIGREDLDTLVVAGMDVQRLLQNNKRTVTAADAEKLYAEIL